MKLSMPRNIALHLALLATAVMLVPPVVLADGAIPYKTSDPDVGGLFTRMLLLLGVLCAVGALAAVFLRKRLVRSGMVPDKSGSRIRVSDRRVLSRKAMVHLLDVDGRDVLVLESDHGVSVTELTLRAAAPASAPAAANAETQP